MDGEIRYTLLKEEPRTFNAATKRANALDAISKAESSRLRGRRSEYVRWTKSEQEQFEPTISDLRALDTSLATDFNQMIEFQTKSFNKMLEQQKRHTETMEKILETQTRLLTESTPSRLQSRSPGRQESFRPKTSTMQCYNCREFGHLPINALKKEQNNRVF